ncbi:MAG: aldo/keto reductase [Actinobacteria bacterium]|nr:MAG: aldo/keto reductase [Actinomycetota bacterium]
MRYVEVGGVRVSAIGLGTWQFGSMEWGYGSAYAEHDALDIVARALELGINLVDTAEIYAFGRSERIVGRALAGRRDEAFLATKILPVLPLPPVIEQRARGSIRRLNVDHLDLYQLHWPNPVVPIGPTMAGMRQLRRSGLVRNVGVSNFSLGAWRQAESALGAPVLSNQVQYSLVARAPERDLLGWARENDRLVIAYSPLGQGFLSGRYSAEHRPGGLRGVGSLFLPENLDRGAPLLAALRDIAKVHDATAAQVALAWVIRRPNVVAIPGASSVAQVESNAAAADLVLSDEEDARLSAASDAFEPVSGPAAVLRIIETLLRRA